MEPVRWPQHLRLVNQWIKDRTGYSPYTVLPEITELRARLPAVRTSLSPSGTLGVVERSASVDIDLLAGSWKDMNPLIQTMDSCMAALAGNGNQYGYVDDVSGTAFSDVPFGDPAILRCTATFSLVMRPVNS
ncbi:hypothetical protein [Bifidobacterium bombi]|uniref:Tail terminator n=1 Tax=Bifidobacterium bombi DSM 19703 TaxID=1341695 RepID=A0A080N3C5_9BIFI|nr:hypothetical protein [Bifidobacterium bombi]KFF31648.1 hypothetical protein BBOMB_1034 [Bifidobacterium bombi DSM 19703]